MSEGKKHQQCCKAAVQALLVKQVQGANKSQVQLVTGEPSPESLLLLERNDVEFTIASASGLPGIKCNFYSHFHLFKTLETRDDLLETLFSPETLFS